jgi:hypothetical protein
MRQSPRPNDLRFLVLSAEDDLVSDRNLGKMLRRTLAANESVPEEPEPEIRADEIVDLMAWVRQRGERHWTVDEQS